MVLLPAKSGLGLLSALLLVCKVFLFQDPNAQKCQRHQRTTQCAFRRLSTDLNEICYFVSKTVGLDFIRWGISHLAPLSRDLVRLGSRDSEC